MPEVEYRGETVDCKSGETLRQVLLDNGLSPHVGVANALNCGGNSTCGTCAVRVVDGDVGERTAIEDVRLRIATHDDTGEVRLACQYEVTEDVVIEQP